MNVQVKAAAALEALAQENTASQKAFLDLDAPSAIMKLFTKVRSLFYRYDVARVGGLLLRPKNCLKWNSREHLISQRKDIHVYNSKQSCFRI